MSDSKRQVKVDLEDLKFAFESGFTEARQYLDLETGEVVLIGDETRRQLETLLDGMDLDSIEAVDAAIHGEDAPAWQKDALHGAALVVFGDTSRFIAIPEADSRAGYEDMVAFIDTVSNQHLQELLEVAIQGRGAFRRFKDVLAKHPQERERWFRFHDQRVQQRVLDWLDEEGITPIV